MATVYGTTYLAQNGQSTSRLPIGDVGGRVRSLYFTHTFAADVNAISDIVKLCKLPKGARVVGGRLYSPSLGTTGIFHWGWAASAELDSAGTALELIDADGFGVSLDAGGQAVDSTMAGTVGGFLKKFAADVDVQLTLTEATDSAINDVIKGALFYVVD